MEDLGATGCGHLRAGSKVLCKCRHRHHEPRGHHAWGTLTCGASIADVVTCHKVDGFHRTKGHPFSHAQRTGDVGTWKKRGKLEEDDLRTLSFLLLLRKLLPCSPALLHVLAGPSQVLPGAWKPGEQHSLALSCRHPALPASPPEGPEVPELGAQRLVTHLVNAFLGRAFSAVGLRI